MVGTGIPQRSHLHVNTVIYCGFMAPPPAERHDKELNEEGRMETFTEPNTGRALLTQEKGIPEPPARLPILRGGLHLTAGTPDGCIHGVFRESIAEIASPLN